MSKAAKILIVTADDFGASSLINRAVQQAHSQGILTSASLMVTGAAFDQAIAIARENPDLAVGIHITLLQGKSVLAAREITPLVNGSGSFSENPVSAGFQYFFSKRARQALKKEMEAQIQMFLATGLVPTHVDGHHHLHLHPGVLPLLLELLQKYSIPSIRLPRDPLRINLRLSHDAFAMKIVIGSIYRLLCSHAEKKLQQIGIQFPDRFFGLLTSGNMTESYILSVLDHIKPGITEIGLHPALDVPPELMKWAHHYAFQQEFDLLTSPRVKVRLETRGIRLASYRIFQDNLTRGGC